MPLKVPDNLPAKKILENERIILINESRAFNQDIRPLKIIILNLMPLKEDTELDLLRVLSNSPLQIEVTFAHMESHISKNTPIEHLEMFYKYVSEISHNKYDGMIITGAPVEQLPFEDVNYWNELKAIMDWSLTSVTNTLHICWGAQAGLYHHYGVPKYSLEKKLFGVFKHYNTEKLHPLLKGFDDEYFVPHSRHTTILEEDIIKHNDLYVVSKSDDAGVNIVINRNDKQVFVTGHFEYNSETLNREYVRDINKNLDIDIPKNYYKDNNPDKDIVVRWKANGYLLFNNWLNHIYQKTPYDISQIGEE